MPRLSVPVSSAPSHPSPLKRQNVRTAGITNVSPSQSDDTPAKPVTKKTAIIIADTDENKVGGVEIDVVGGDTGLVASDRLMSPKQHIPPPTSRSMMPPNPPLPSSSSSSSSSGVAVQQQQQDAASAAHSQLQEVVRSPYVIYPDQYSKFDVKRVSFTKEPQTSNEGGGQILFMSYMYENVLKPLLIQTPNGMHAPTGITIWPDGKASMLMSVGRDWEINPLMVTFKSIIDAIQKRCEEVAAEKQWNSPGPNDVAIIHDGFTPIAFIGEGQKGDLYPPSIKASLVMTGNNRTELHEFSDVPPYRPMVPGDVTAGSSVTAIVHVAWVFRKKSKKTWQFSVRVNLFQAVIEVPNSGRRNGGCVVCC